MAKLKMKFTRSPAAEALMCERVETMNARNGVDKYGHPVRWTPMDTAARMVERMDASLQWAEYSDGIPKAVVSRAKKDFGGEMEFTYLLADNGGRDNGYFLFAPLDEEAFLDALRQAWQETDTEERLAPLLAEEHKQKAHKFLTEKAIFSKRGGKHRVREEMLAYAQGYLRAWEKFGGEKVHPRPYVLVPPYGRGSFGVAYLLCMPPEQLIEEFENEFAVVLVMKA